MEVTIKMDTSTVKGKVSAIRNIVSMGAIPMDRRLEYVREILGEQAKVDASPPQRDLPSLPRITVRPGSALDERKRAISNRSKDSVPRFFNGTVSKNWDMVNSVPELLAGDVLDWILRRNNKTWVRLESRDGVGGKVTHDGYAAYAFGSTGGQYTDIPETYLIAALLLGFKRRDIAATMVKVMAYNWDQQQQVPVDRIRFHSVLYAAKHPNIEWLTEITPEMRSNPYLFRSTNINDSFTAKRFNIAILMEK